MQTRQIPVARWAIALLVAALGIVGFVGFNAVESSAAQEISAKALSGHECNSTEWHFVITQVDTEADAPSSIHVTWANGASADVPLEKFTGGVAHYTTTANLDSTVTSATASIYDAWSGEFNLSHGPCGPAPTTAPATTASPATSTPIEVGGSQATRPGAPAGAPGTAGGAAGQPAPAPAVSGQPRTVG